ncbi:DUF5131 family protein [Streptomyces angustmyceticus]|uniref:DUF5131 family protein n=1 Tax=Streptomyces angustmyceticus TaxID=285578 RepID=UPI003697A707
MSDNSAIEWTDATWNPVTGCTKVSPGCDNCYADTFSERWRGIAGHYFENGFDIQLRPNKMTVPLTWKKPRRVFVNSMSDLFHPDIHDADLHLIFGVMAATPQHTYQILTKRHGRMRSLLNDPQFAHMAFHRAGMYGRPDTAARTWPLPNIHLGVSVENQKWADTRIPALLDTPAAVRFLSCEPLLGPVTLPFLEETDDCTCAFGPPDHPHHPTCGLTPGPAWNRLHWVIVGGESGRGARPMDPAWATQIVQQCQRSNVPVFVKQLGSRWGKQHKDIDLFPAELRVRQFPETTAPALS